MARSSAVAVVMLLFAGAQVARAADGDFEAVPAVGTASTSVPARFCYVFAQENQREVFLRNSDPLVRAKLRVSLGREWLFVYADMGGGSSTLRWQSLVGIRVGQRAHLLAGWRGMTYYLSPGGDFNSLDIDGPFIGAQRAW